VPEYEQEFLWDHTYQLRIADKRRAERKSYADQYASQPSPKYQRAGTATTPAPDLGSRSRSYDSVRGGYQVEHESSTGARGRKHAASNSFSEKHRQASHESVNSVYAPNPEDVSRMRRNSRTLSNDNKKPHYKSSRESVRSSHGGDSRKEKEHRWASDGETTSHRKSSSGIFSGIKKSLGRSSSSKDYVKQRSASGDERTSSGKTAASSSSRLKKKVEYDSDDSDDWDLEMSSKRRSRSPSPRRPRAGPTRYVVNAGRRTVPVREKGKGRTVPA